MKHYQSNDNGLKKIKKVNSVKPTHYIDENNIDLEDIMYQYNNGTYTEDEDEESITNS